jgi:uncharacterized membrane protein YesL
MKHFKRILRTCALILFMLLAVAGIGIFGVAPTLTKDRKLFADIEVKSEASEKNDSKNSNENLNDLFKT